MDETWEMNLHFNPIDQETASTLKKHIGLIVKHTDDYIQYINHTEKSRKQAIKDYIFKEKLKDFALVDEKPETSNEFLSHRNKGGIRSKKNKEVTMREHGSKSPESDVSYTPSVKEAFELEDEEKITDFKEPMKTSHSFNMDPNRFTCKLGKYA